MRPAATAETITILIALLVGTAYSTPTPWSESLLEDINNLRASGLSEADIALRFPRALFYPNPTSPPKITLYSPPDLRTYSRNSNHKDSNRPSFMARLAHKLGLPLGGGGDGGGCDDYDDDADDNDDGRDGGLFLELVNEEARRQGKARLWEGVGKRGGQMGRMEDSI